MASSHAGSLSAKARTAETERGAYRNVLGHFATGVAALTGLAEGEPTGLAINSFTSVSLSPPLVLFCVAHQSTTWSRLRNTDGFCVNVLAEHQHDVCRRLASRGPDKFHGTSWSASPAGLPVIDGAIAWLECSVETEHSAGDHDIVVAIVRYFGTGALAAPLIFYHGTYGRFTAARAAPEYDRDLGEIGPPRS